MVRIHLVPIPTKIVQGRPSAKPKAREKSREKSRGKAAGIDACPSRRHLSAMDGRNGMDADPARERTTSERLAEWARKGARGAIRGGAGLAVAAALSGAALLHEGAARASEEIAKAEAMASQAVEKADHLSLKPIERMASARLAGPATAVQSEYLSRFRDLRARYEADFPQDAASIGHIEPYGGDGRTAVLSRISALGLSKAAAALTSGDRDQRAAATNYGDLASAGGVTQDFEGRSLIVVAVPSDAVIEDPARPGRLSEGAKVQQDRTFWHESWHATAFHRGWKPPEGKDYGNWQEVGAQTFEVLMAMRDHPQSQRVGGGKEAAGEYARAVSVTELTSSTFKIGSGGEGQYGYAHYSPEALLAVQQAWSGRMGELREKSVPELADEARRLADVNALTVGERASLSEFSKEVGEKIGSEDVRGRMGFIDDALRSSTDPAVVRAAAHAREAMPSFYPSVPKKGGAIGALARSELALAEGAMPVRMEMKPGSAWPVVETTRLADKEAASLPKPVGPADIKARHDPAFAEILARRDKLAADASAMVEAPYAGTDAQARAKHDAPFEALAVLNAAVGAGEEAVFSDPVLSAELAKAEKEHGRKFLASVEALSKQHGAEIDLSRCSVLPAADGSRVEAGCSDQEGKWTAGLKPAAGGPRAAAGTAAPAAGPGAAVDARRPHGRGTPWNLDDKEGPATPPPGAAPPPPPPAVEAPPPSSADLDAGPDRSPLRAFAEKIAATGDRAAWWSGGLAAQQPKAASFMPYRSGLDMRLPEGAGALALPVSKSALDGSSARLLKGLDSGRLAALAAGSRKMEAGTSDVAEKDAFELGYRAAAKELSGRGIVLEATGYGLSSGPGRLLESLAAEDPSKASRSKARAGDEGVRG